MRGDFLLRHHLPMSEILVRRGVNRLLLALGCAIAMTGSAFADNASVAAAQRPATKAEIAGVLEGMRNFLHDPYSVRDVEISGVMTAPMLLGTRRSGSAFAATPRTPMKPIPGGRPIWFT
jgi:hypothetical protein